MQGEVLAWRVVREMFSNVRKAVSLYQRLKGSPAIWSLSFLSQKLFDVAKQRCDDGDFLAVLSEIYLNDINSYFVP